MKKELTKQERYRLKQRKNGRKPKQFYLTEKEHKKTSDFINKMRGNKK